MSSQRPGDGPVESPHLFDPEGWHPIGRSDDAPFRHVHQAKLAGREFAVWRADDGFVNVWDNRCPHRGVRLSVGLNEGLELKCLYHGWHYASRTGGCTYIPAHPADAPAQSIGNRTFPSAERYGLIWTTERGAGEPPRFTPLELATPFALRSLPIAAAPRMVLDHLADYRFLPHGASEGETVTTTATSLGPLAIQIVSSAGRFRETAVLFVQPVDTGECVVHSVLTRAPDGEQQKPVWHQHAAELGRLRDEVEARAAREPRPDPIVPALERIEPSEQRVPMPASRNEARLRVVVQRKWATAEGVSAFELVSTGAPLPASQPGSHIDVHLPNGLVRQYSLTNRAGDTAHYIIGVKLEPESRGGSSCLHGSVQEGDVLAISAPRNNFTLRRDAVDTVLVAGGIGITALLAMAETLSADGSRFHLHHFSRSRHDVAFADRLTTLSSAVTAHLGLSPEETGDRLDTIFSHRPSDAHTYICGPGPMLDVARRVADHHGWPDGAVHFEYFKNATELDQSTAFRVRLARSGVTLDVGAGETILDVLRSHGIAMPSSCEQGACGTCLLGVIAGEPIHQDVHLNSTERAAGDRILTCVSRAASAELVLDI